MADSKPNPSKDDPWGCVREVVEKMRKTPKGESAPAVKRFDRLMEVREKQRNEAKQKEGEDTKIDKAWLKIVKNAHSLDAAMNVFWGLPDEVSDQPFLGLSQGKRVSTPTVEREKYLEMTVHAKALIDYLKVTSNGDPLRRLIADLDVEPGFSERLPSTTDASTMHNHATEAIVIWNVGVKVRPTLNFLFHAFKGANPWTYRLTKQPESKNAAMQTYIYQVAELNSYLDKDKPQHAALAALASANISDVAIKVDAIRQAWAKFKAKTE